MDSKTTTVPQALALAVAHHKSGRLSEAERIYRQILARDPNQPDALQLLGALLGQRGDLPAAERLIRKSLEIQPANAHALLNLGEFCRRMGRPGEALSIILEGIRYRPSAAAYDSMASILRDLTCHEAASDALRTALKFDPKYTPAVSTLDRAQHTPPRPRPPLTNLKDARECIALCAAFTHLHRYEDAIAAALRASEIQPLLPDPHVNLGWLYTQVDRLDDAIAACERAISLNPQDAAAHINLGTIRLLQGDFSGGWPLYEFRKQCWGYGFAKYPQPQWDGSPLNGKRILLWFEQGLGDTLQFLRYVPLVQSLGGKVILSVQPELRRLVEANIKVEEIIDPAKPLPNFDVQCSLLSLPLALRTTLQTIPGGTPYLKPPEELIATWSEKIKPCSHGMRVGLAWAGSPSHINDANRSMQLKDLAPLAASGAIFFSLQKRKVGFSNTDPDGSMQLIDWTDQLTDLADTAALIANLDLVITVDSVVAHLAGAMAKPVFLLLPKTPDWRWLLDREDSPWYPTMKIFRQENRRDWKTSVTRAAAAIRPPR